MLNINLNLNYFHHSISLKTKFLNFLNLIIFIVFCFVKYTFHKVIFFKIKFVIISKLIQLIQASLVKGFN